MPDCAHCDNEISPRAAVCPRCGHPGPAQTPGIESQPGLKETWSETDILSACALGASIAGLTVVPLAGSIVGLILAYIARGKLADSPSSKNASLVRAALIIGWVGVVLGILVLLALAVVLAFAVISG